MPEALSIAAAAVPPHLEAGRQLQRHLHRLGVSAEGLRQVGRAGLPAGAHAGRRSTAARKWRAGGSRSGTSRTSATGTARRRSITSSTTIAADGVKRALPTARIGGPRRHRPERRAAAADAARVPGALRCAARTTPPARPARRWTSSSFHAKGAPRLRRRPRADGRREPAARHRRRASRSSPRSPS